MSQSDAKLFEKYRVVGIAFFVMFIVLVGVLLIAYGSLGKLDATYSVIATSLGSALIGVGLVDLLSEAFIRPGNVGIMRKMMNQFISDPSQLPKSLRAVLVRAFVEALSPNEALSSEIAQLFDDTFLTQLTSTYRSDCKISLKLRKVTVAGNILAQGTTEVSYYVHNLTSRTNKYSIPFAFNTVSFVSKKIPIEEHVKLLRISVTDSQGKSTDIGATVSAYTVRPKEHALFSSKVELALPQSPTFDIAPNGTITIFLKYVYLAQLIDDHVHKMKELTRNIDLSIDFLEDDFLVDIDTFCIPKMNEINPKRKFSWRGWFLPHHGFCVAWQPT